MEAGEYCIYLRKSRTDREAELRGEGETLARHEKTLTGLAKEHNISIQTIYREIVSGETISSRPAMKMLLNEVEQGRWAGVLVMEVERLARGDTIDQGIVAQAFQYSGTKIITPAKIYDPNNEFDEEYFEFGLFMSRREYKAITRRLQRGRTASVQEGKFIGSTPPFGYLKVKLPFEKGFTLAINENNANTIKMIYHWYCIGEAQPDGSFQRLGTEKIAARLDSLAIKPPLNSKWSRTTINDILKNPCYAGYIRFGYRKEYKVLKDSTLITSRRNTSQCIKVPGLHPAIISEDLFLLAEEIRQLNRKNPHPCVILPQNPLSGLIYCKKCNSLMTRMSQNSKNQYAVLKCPNRYCSNISAPLSLIEEQIILFLQDWLSSYKTDPEADTGLYSLGVELEFRRSLSLSCQNELGLLQSQLASAYSLLEQGIYTAGEFRLRKELLEEQIRLLQKSNSDRNREIAALLTQKQKKEKYIPKAYNLMDGYKECTICEKNEILKKLLDRVCFLKEEKNTRGNLMNANFALDIYPRVPAG